MIDGFTNTRKVTVDIHIGKPHYFQVHLLKFTGSPFIFFHLRLCIVSCPIKFNHELCFRTVKIHDILTYRLLTLKTNRIVPQKLIP